MAHHKRRKHYRGLMKVGFGALSYPKTLDTKDAAIGLAMGVGAALAARALWNQFAGPAATASAISKNADGSSANPLMAFVYNNLSPIGALVGAALAYFVGKRKNVSRAESHAAGAAFAAGSMALFNNIQALAPQFQGFQMVRFGSRYSGILIPDQSRRFQGLIAPANSAFVPGYNTAAGSGRSTSGAKMSPALARSAPRMSGLIARTRPI